ncbi:MAG: amidohydrolase family protein [Nanoarchaeota archaeon]
MKNRVWLVGVAIVVTAVLLLFVFGGDTKERISEDAGKEGGLEERSEETVRENNSNIEDEEQEELSAEEQAWKERVDAALAPVPCISVQGPTYAEEYYTGKLIDAHYHIADIPDSDPLGNQEEEQESDEPLLGVNIKIDDIICTLEQEGTAKVFAFFSVYPEIPGYMTELAERTMQKYPDYFVPFIMPPEDDDDPNGYPTVDAKVLEEMLSVYPGLFQGYGEIGLYERQDGAKELPPNSERLLEIYPVIRENKLVVYFHLGEGQQEEFEEVLEENPDINFIWHGDQLVDNSGGTQKLEILEEILYNHPNAYYGIDELYGDEFMINPKKTKKQFLAHLEDYEDLLKEDSRTWKGFIKRHPDQVLWGTDRSDQVLWSHDPEVGIALSNYARAFIALLDEDVQEKFAYKNAESLFE